MPPRRRRSQAVSHPLPDRTQRSSSENIPQIPLIATHQDTDVQSKSIAQNVTNSTQPNHSE